MALTSMLAQASETSDGGEIIAFLIICCFLWGIYSACTKKKSYNVRLGGTIKEN